MGFQMQQNKKWRPAWDKKQTDPKYRIKPHLSLSAGLVSRHFAAFVVPILHLPDRISFNLYFPSWFKKWSCPCLSSLTCISIWAHLLFLPIHLPRFLVTPCFSIASCFGSAFSLGLSLLPPAFGSLPSPFQLAFCQTLRPLPFMFPSSPSSFHLAFSLHLPSRPHLMFQSLPSPFHISSFSPHLFRLPFSSLCSHLLCF